MHGSTLTPSAAHDAVANTQQRATACSLSPQEALLGAFNATNLASGYIERGNFAAARRKLMLALQALNQLQTEA